MSIYCPISWTMQGPCLDHVWPTFTSRIGKSFQVFQSWSPFSEGPAHGVSHLRTTPELFLDHVWSIFSQLSLPDKLD